MRILFIGDIVGRSGRNALLKRLPDLIRDWKLDFVAVNGENAAGGFGITEQIYQEIVDAGADAITGGNHSWDQREALVFIERAPRLLRPLNYPAGTPGRGSALIETRNGARVLIVNVMGRIFMDALDDPFAAVERELVRLRAQARGRRHHRRHPLRGDQREAGDGRVLRRPRLAGGRHPHPCADRRPSGAAGRHRFHLRRRHDRRLRLHHRHDQGRAAQPLPAQDSRRAGSSRRSARRRCARSRSRPTTRPGSRAMSARCGLAGGWSRRGRRFGIS